jgi:hypothetical protein
VLHVADVDFNAGAIINAMRKAREQDVQILIFPEMAITGYTLGDLHKWLRSFIERFFASQFKRTCLPEGPKIGSVSLSPRGDWRMPSDAEAKLWLEDMEAMYMKLRQ